MPAALRPRLNFGVTVTCCAIVAMSVPGRADEPAADRVAAGPLTPEASLAAFQIDAGLTVEVLAAEPDVIDPVFAAFDPRGRLWVVEMRDYPNGPAPGEPGQSRIRILTDADGDGRYSDPETFADELLFANSLMLWQRGALVTTDGRLDFLADEDGDGRAEFRETWFQGFARENPQLRCNHPTLGLDGRIHVANGLRGGTVVAARPGWLPGKPLTLGNRDFRFDPRDGAAAATSGFGQFGMSFDDFGRRFLCSNRNPCMHAVLPDDFLRLNPNVAVAAVTADVAAAGAESRILPISHFWTTSNLHAGQFTAACGVRIYRGNALPPAYYGNVLTCDPTGNLVHREVLQPEGATFRGTNPDPQREFLASPDTWFRPVDLTVAPDGSLIVVDMCRAVIEHPEYMPDELKNRPDLALGRDKGRIYRVRSKSLTAARTIDVTDTPALVRALDDANVWQRETAFRLLIETPRIEAVSLLRDLLHSAATAAGKTNALWVLANLGQLTESDLQPLFNSTDANLLEQTISLAAHFVPPSDSLIDAVYQLAERDLDSRLRFQLAVALGAFPREPRRQRALVQLLAADVDNSWLATAVAISAADEVPQIANQFLEEIGRRDRAYATASLDAVGRLVETIGAMKATDALPPLLSAIDAVGRQLDDQRLRWTSRSWDRLAQGLRTRREVPGDVLPKAARQAGIEWDPVLAEAVGTSLDPSAAVESRCDAIRMLEFADAEQALPVLRQCLDDVLQPIQTTATRVLAVRPEPDVATLLLNGFSGRSPAVQREILSAVLASSGRISVLLDEIDQRRIPATELDANRLQQLSGVRDADLRARIDRLAASLQPADRAQVLADYQAALARRGEPLKGRNVFARHCATCHRIGDLGVNVAPDISDSRVKQSSQLLTDILDPNRAIDNNYFSYAVIDRDGLVHSGIVGAETATSITLRQPEDKRETLRRADIESMRSLGVSLMPVGLEKSISVAEMADLISFIKNWRYLDGSVPPEVIR